MKYTIKNDRLRAEFASLGGELLSLSSNGGLEYIWQGDKKYWGGHSPILFPYCCRLFDGRYTHKGQSFDGNIHGFIRRTEFCDVEAGEDFVIFRKSSDEDTKKLYPFDFEFELKYKLNENNLICEIKVSNTGEEELFYCEGMHPGFNLPLGDGSFDDWYLEFSEPATPRRVLFSESKFCCGDKDFTPCLENGKKLALSHSLFDDEAIFLLDACRSVTLKSDISDHSVKVDYPDSQVVGFWQPEHTDAPFICIEPLGGLPSYDGKVDEMSEKAFARCVPSGQSHTDTVTITIN